MSLLHHRHASLCFRLKSLVFLILAGLLLLRLSAEEQIDDREFKFGFSLLEPKPGKQISYGTLSGPSNSSAPAWKIAQWNSRVPLAPEAAVHKGNRVTCENRAKSVMIDGETGTLILSANSKKEYGSKGREKATPWIHLLIEQRFENFPTPFSTAISPLPCRG